MSKSFLEKHAAAMVCHRREYSKSVAGVGWATEASFTALADYADELAAKLAEFEVLLAKLELVAGRMGRCEKAAS